MCGIAGYVGDVRSGGIDRRSAAAVLESMCEAIRHRGPDDQGTIIKGTAALGMRRLSIIDLSGGHQPMSG